MAARGERLLSSGQPPGRWRSAGTSRHARLRLDLTYGDLALALAGGAWARGLARRAQRVEQRFGAGAVVALSARSGFDLYLSALALPPGSEVLVSGLTIAHMAALLEAHGLAVVPFALDPDTLAPPPGELERRATARTRAVLFAHLFGARAEVAAAHALARARGWLWWEDCAQAWAGDAWRGEPGADLVLFSFGLIKSASAVQGGLACVHDAGLRGRMRELAATWPVQARLDYVRRVLRAAGLLALTPPGVYAHFVRLSARRGLDLDELLHAATRGFPGADFRARLQRRPCAALLSLLERRLARPRRSECAAKQAFGEELLAALGPGVEVYGRAARERHHWVLALGVDEPAQLVRSLRAAGFDATARSSLVALAPSCGGEPPDANRRILERLVYVPLALEASPAERAELVRLLRAEARPHVLRPIAGAAELQRG
jgi:dTDP-4-amino-4,6-dideoxygalactose transaminase